MSTGEDEDIPQLSIEASAALQEYYRQQANFLNRKENEIDENWQLSQFWYDESTANTLAQIALQSTRKSIINSSDEDNGKIALISSPTLYKPIKNKSEEGHNSIVHLYEFDRRFSAIAAQDYHFYDYNSPLSHIPEEHAHLYDLVIADPPFLSEECITKTAITINYLAKDKIILCTGSVMGELVKKVLNLDKTEFQPKHQNNLANEFSCYANYDISQFKN